MTEISEPAAASYAASLELYAKGMSAEARAHLMRSYMQNEKAEEPSPELCAEIFHQVLADNESPLFLYRYFQEHPELFDTDTFAKVSEAAALAAYAYPGPGDDLDDLVNKGMVALYGGDPFLASRLFEACVKYDKEDFCAKYFLMASKQGFNEDCQEDLKGYVEKIQQTEFQDASDLEDAWDMYYAGQLLVLGKEYDGAEALFEKASDLIESDLMRVLIAGRKGEDKRAAALMDEILRHRPDAEKYLETEQDFPTLRQDFAIDNVFKYSHLAEISAPLQMLYAHQKIRKNDTLPPDNTNPVSPFISWLDFDALKEELKKEPKVTLKQLEGEIFEAFDKDFFPDKKTVNDEYIAKILSETYGLLDISGMAEKIVSAAYQMGKVSAGEAAFLTVFSNRKRALENPDSGADRAQMMFQSLKSIFHPGPGLVLPGIEEAFAVMKGLAGLQVEPGVSYQEMKKGFLVSAAKSGT